MAHFVFVTLVDIGIIVALILAALVLGAVLVAQATAWFSGPQRGRPVPTRRTFETDLPPHSTPLNAM